MKTKLLTVALLLISVSAFAQKAFDKSTFDALMNRYAQDPVKFLKTETSPDFVLAGSDGSFWNTERTGQVYERNTQTGRTYENVVVRQYGNTGVATGILTHSYVGKASGQPSQFRESFTFVFNSPKAGQWQMVSAQSSTAPAGTVAENEAAIKKIIESSTTAVYANDIPTYKKSWATGPYISRVSSSADGQLRKIVGDEFKKAYDDWEKNGKVQEVAVTRENWLIRINGNSAFAVFDQYNKQPDGTNRHSVEERYLERTNGEWKLVNVTVLTGK